MDYTDTVKKAVEFIHCQFSEPITVSDVANHVYLSSSYFSTVFRTLTGFTMKKYILRYRLYRTALELKKTNRKEVHLWT